MIRSKRCLAGLFPTQILVTTAFLSCFVILPSIALARSISSTSTATASGTRKTYASRSLHSTKFQQESVRRFSYLDSRAIYEALASLADQFPNLSTLENAQFKYHLEAAGGEDDCPFDHHNVPEVQQGCLNWIFTIEDKAAHPEGSDSYKALPEVFLSGALHGNERIGPTTVVETAALLLDAANCEGFPRGNPPTKKSSNLQWSQWEDELQTARRCREELAYRGITPYYRKWLARLVTTRRIVIVPTPNALGYFRNEREEHHKDPNRDFPYDLTDHACMMTIAGRTINEIFREHMFQLSLTYHAGMAAVAYEWGAPSFKGKLSPDHIAQSTIAEGYSNYAGPLPVQWEKTGAYPYGPMNDLVYPVRGGMEDWAYAGSWDPDRVTTCHPDTYGGYSTDKTTYNNATLRMFNMLVETSGMKIPTKETLGTNKDLFDSEGEGTGHIARNIRLALTMIDVVEPYAFFTAVDGKYLQDDIVPLTDRTGTNCIKTKVIKVPQNGVDNDGTLLQWTVGGGFDVTETGLIYSKWEDMPDSFDGSTQPTMKMIEAFSNMRRVTLEDGGRTRWNTDGAFPSFEDEDMSDFLGPSFSAKIDLTEFAVGDEIAVMAYTMVDQHWIKSPNSDIGPDLPPQSHVVNARTNPDWHFESAGKVIQGREWFFSTPVTLIVKENDNQTVELAMRLPMDTQTSTKTLEIVEKEITDVFTEGEEAAESHSILLIGGIASFVLFVGAVFIFRRRKERAFVYVDSPHSDIDEEDGFEDGSLELSEKYTIS